MVDQQPERPLRRRRHPNDQEPHGLYEVNLDEIEFRPEEFPEGPYGAADEPGRLGDS